MCVIMKEKEEYWAKVNVRELHGQESATKYSNVEPIWSGLLPKGGENFYAGA